ncbi:hypothetical protein ACRAWD_30310 [Caulobacter segnis]
MPAALTDRARPRPRPSAWRLADKAGAKNATATADLQGAAGGQAAGQARLAEHGGGTFSGPMMEVDGRLVTGSAVEEASTAAGAPGQDPAADQGPTAIELGIIPGFPEGHARRQDHGPTGPARGQAVGDLRRQARAERRHAPVTRPLSSRPAALAGLAARERPVGLDLPRLRPRRRGQKRKDWRGTPHSRSDPGLRLRHPGQAEGRRRAPQTRPRPAAGPTAWAAFAKTGDPGWAAYDPATDLRMTVTNDSGAALAATPGPHPRPGRPCGTPRRAEPPNNNKGRGR